MFERFVREYAPYLIGIAVFIVAMAFLWFLIAMARAEPLDPPRYPGSESRSWPQPHYLPSWERTQRRYLPSYQYEQGRRAICGSFCEDTPRRRRDPFERQ